MALLELANVEINLAEFVLSVDRLSIHAGTIVHIEGPNGSGKSTLCRALMCVQKIATGVRRCPKDARFGYVPQAYKDALMPWMTAYQNLSLLQPISSQHLRWAVKMGLSRAELSRRPQRLSGGQCQRIVIIREAIYRPDFLILDEPFSNLDTHTIGLAAEVILRAASLGSGVVLVSHSRVPVMIDEAISKRYRIERTSERRALVLEQL